MLYHNKKCNIRRDVLIQERVSRNSLLKKNEKIMAKDLQQYNTHVYIGLMVCRRSL